MRGAGPQVDQAEYRAESPMSARDAVRGIDASDVLQVAESAIRKVAERSNPDPLKFIAVSVRIFDACSDEHTVLCIKRLSERSGTSQWRVELQDSSGKMWAEVAAVVQPLIHAPPTTLQTYPRNTVSGAPEPPRSVDPGAEQLTVAEERGDQIVKGAYSVISRKGFAKATTREIAEAAGLPTATMYLYIRSKDDLLPMIFEHFAGKLVRQYSENLSRTNDITATLSEAVGKYLDYCERNRRFINFIYRETRNINRKGREKLFAADRSFTNSWAEILEVGKKSGEFKIDHPKIVAELIYFACTAWAIRYWSLGAFPKTQVLQNIMQFVLQGVGTMLRPTPARAAKAVERKAMRVG